jgi:hypothetical protein
VVNHEKTKEKSFKIIALISLLLAQPEESKTI